MSDFNQSEAYTNDAANGESPCRVGQTRPSQLIWAYGPGAIVDLMNFSVMTMGIDSWNFGKMTDIIEPRLLAEVRKILGPHIAFLKTPPVPLEDVPAPYSSGAFVGVPVKPFPRWIRCLSCGRLAPYDSGLFEIRGDARYGQVEFVHKNCGKAKHNKGSDAVPARFLVACQNGHVDDFPWSWYVHRGPADCKGALYFKTQRTGARAEDLIVRCDECGAQRTMRDALGGHFSGVKCRGRHFHLDSFEECDETPQVLLVGASNAWFPVSVSALALPTDDNKVDSIVAQFWDALKQFSSSAYDTLEKFQDGLSPLLNVPIFQDLRKFPTKDLFSSIKKKGRASSADADEKVDLKTPEWRVLSQKDPPSDYPHFETQSIAAPEGFEDSVQNVVLLNRLRKVNALVGFTRIESQNEILDEEGQTAKRVPISKNDKDWVPAIEVHGEGVFLRFNEEKLAEWERRPGVIKRERTLVKAQKAWASSLGIQSDISFPGVRYVMLHTLSHLLIREMALKCGYSEASLQERIYASKPQAETPMAGILIYTASPDSDGTLGGLVELGEPSRLGELLNQALDRALVCSSDPFCSTHDGQTDASLHGASCHSCSFVSETSCENCNRYLDRALLVKTFETEDAAFFPEKE